jgi:hypothetical protein
MNITLNRLMIADRALMLGQAMVAQHGMYGRNEFTVKATGVISQTAFRKLSSAFCQRIF